MPLSQNEAFSRVLIDRALDDSDWDLLNSKQVEFEFHTASGRADYLLKDKLGRVFCVLEAKREDVDPYDAKEQARGYLALPTTAALFDETTNDISKAHDAFCGLKGI